MNNEQRMPRLNQDDNETFGCDLCQSHYTINNACVCFFFGVQYVKIRDDFPKSPNILIYSGFRRKKSSSIYNYGKASMRSIYFGAN